MKQLSCWVKHHPIAFALIFFACYLSGFFALEQRNTVPVFLLHCRLDDIIPFCEWFIFAYLSWFALIPWALVTLLRRDRANYFYLCGVLFSGMALCLLLYFLFPNGVELRPGAMEHRNLAALLVQSIWALDTSTNVCPSIHVASTAAILLAVQRSHIWKCRKMTVGICWGLGILICLSTLFLKQHSVIDVVCGIALTAILHLFFSRRHFASPTPVPLSDSIS
jgi:membrane-associated phospholipid phosphatase